VDQPYAGNQHFLAQHINRYHKPSFFFWDKIGEQKHDIFCRFLTFCKFAPGNLVEWAFDVVENKQSITSQFHQKWPVQASQQIPAKA
jgi:hypothetical protein